MIDFLRRHWCVAAALVLVAVAFIAGRASAPTLPARVETREVVRWRTRTVEKRVEVASASTAQAKRVIVYRDRVIQPDGTRHEREIETTATDTQVHAQVAKREARIETHEQHEDRRAEITAPRPQWRVSLLAGVQIRSDPLDLYPVFGAQVERRIVGPVSLGVWGLHTGVVGISISTEF